MELKSVLVGFYVGAILILETSVMSAEMGPYEINNVHLLACEDQGNNDMNISIQMYRVQDRMQRTFAHRGRFTWPANSERIKLFMKFYRKGTDWILVTEYKDDLCECLSLMTDFYYGMLEAIGMNKTCPLPPRQYPFEEWNIKINFPQPVLPYGNYKVDWFLRNTRNETIGCLLAFGDVVKKYPAMKLLG